MLEPAAHDKHSGTDEALSMLWSSSLDSAIAKMLRFQNMLNNAGWASAMYP